MTSSKQSRETLREAVVTRSAGLQRLDSLVPWAKGALIVTGLYFGRAIAVPLIMAVLLSFILAPIVSVFRRIRVPRTPAVLLAVVLALAVTVLTTSIIVNQAATLSADAPAYAQRISEKAASVQSSIRARFGVFSKITAGGRSDAQHRASTRQAGAAPVDAAKATSAVPVELHQAAPTAIQELRTVVLPALAPVETILIVVVVTIFILLRKEDLRDRLIRIMGARDLHRTTRALDDGAKRLSRYFLAQFTVNCAFGAIVWAGLYLIGIPSPGLWGIVAGLLRFVPYIGTALAAVAPLGLAAAVDPHWMMTLYVALLFFGLEPIIGYVIEPILYGHSAGTSPLAVVVAALFWTWIWGPVGLILAMPLTLMLVVLGEHVPGFEVFDVLLGDRPALSPVETFYQRILAGHPDEALEQAEDLLSTMTIDEYYDQIVLEGLRMAARDLDRGAIGRESLLPACDAANDVIRNLEGFVSVSPDASAPQESDTLNASPNRDADTRSIVCISAKGPLDGIVNAMLMQLLAQRGLAVREATRDFAKEESLTAADRAAVEVVSITGLFEERAYRRIERVAAQMAHEFPQARFAIGVKRAREDADLDPTDASLCADGLSGSLAQLVDEVVRDAPKHGVLST